MRAFDSFSRTGLRAPGPGRSGVRSASSAVCNRRIFEGLISILTAAQRRLSGSKHGSEMLDNLSKKITDELPACEAAKHDWFKALCTKVRKALWTGGVACVCRLAFLHQARMYDFRHGEIRPDARIGRIVRCGACAKSQILRMRRVNCSPAATNEHSPASVIWMDYSRPR